MRQNISEKFELRINRCGLRLGNGHFEMRRRSHNLRVIISGRSHEQFRESRMRGI